MPRRHAAIADKMLTPHDDAELIIKMPPARHCHAKLRYAMMPLPAYCFIIYFHFLLYRHCCLIMLLLLPLMLRRRYDITRHDACCAIAVTISLPYHRQAAERCRHAAYFDIDAASGASLRCRLRVIISVHARCYYYDAADATIATLLLRYATLHLPLRHYAPYARLFSPYIIAVAAAAG